MAARKRNKKGQYVKTTRARKNPVVRTASKRPRKRTTSKKRTTAVRRYRRNPPAMKSKIFGLSIADVIFAGSGFVVPPFLEGFVTPYLPTAITANAFGRYGLKVASVAGVSLVGGKFLGRDAAKYLAIGGVTYLVANLIVDYVPQIFSGFGAYMTPGRVLAPAKPAKALSAGMGEYQGMRGESVDQTPEWMKPAY